MQKPFKMSVDPPELLSDPEFREDNQNLKLLEIDKAQESKEKLEEIQRRDAKLRLKFQEARKKKMQHKK